MANHCGYKQKRGITLTRWTQADIDKMTPKEQTEKYKQIVTGKRSKAAGKHFEDQMETACIHYWANGKAHIEKTPEPYKVIRSMGEGKFLCVIEKDGQPDFKGVLEGGRAVIFEAKHTDSERIMQDVILLHQWESLDSHEQMGALCFVMVSLLYHGVYRVPWQDWKNMKQLNGHKFATAEELEKYKVGFHNGVHLFLD